VFPSAQQICYYLFVGPWLEIHLQDSPFLPTRFVLSYFSFFVCWFRLSEISVRCVFRLESPSPILEAHIAFPIVLSPFFLRLCLCFSAFPFIFKPYFFLVVTRVRYLIHFSRKKKENTKTVLEYLHNYQLNASPNSQWIPLFRSVHSR
jgi:hypothetical protein